MSYSNKFPFLEPPSAVLTHTTGFPHVKVSAKNKFKFIIALLVAGTRQGTIPVKDSLQI